MIWFLLPKKGQRRKKEPRARAAVLLENPGGKYTLSFGPAFFIVLHILVTEVTQTFISGAADSIDTSI